MADAIICLACAVLIGAGATATTDIWAVVRKQLGGVAAPDYGLVGRWVAYFAHGRFRHDPISGSPPVRGERLIGWIVHYLTGIAFASILLAVWGVDWVPQPDDPPGAGRRVRQCRCAVPGDAAGMGAGIAAARTADPATARLRSVVTHGVFAIGLYVSGGAANWLTS